MSAGSSDQVDCASLGEAGAVIRREYALGSLPRMRDLLASARGVLHATFVFSTSAAGRPRAAVTIEATPQLVCQRCLLAFELPVTSGSEVELASDEQADAAGSGEDGGAAEIFRIEDGRVSLRDLAEEELLLALPVAPACGTPLTCGRAPEGTAEMRRPFSVLQELLKKP